MSKRINFTVWGRGARDLKKPAYAMADPDGLEAPSSRVAQSISRANGLLVCTLRSEGTALDGRGYPESHHYYTTLGRRCRGGGYTPVAEFWFAIPVTQ
jgi:hypothetical protein